MCFNATYAGSNPFLNIVKWYNYFKTLGITSEINNSDELSLSLVEEFKANRPKNHEIEKKIEEYGLNVLNNVINEIKKYINT